MLRHTSRLLGTSLALALLAGCVHLTRTPLAEEHRKAITSSKTLGNLSQQEIGTSISPSAYGIFIGGLVGVVVDSVVENNRANAAESGAGQLRSLLTGYDPSPAVKAALEKELAGNTTLHGNLVELTKEPLDRTTVTAMVDAAGTDALLVVDYDYHLSPDFDFITVTGVATLFPTKAATSPVLKQLASAPVTDPNLPSPPLYRAVFMSSYPAPADWAGIERWTNEGGTAARTAIEGGIAEVARMLVWDLEQDGPKGGFYAMPGVKAEELRQFPARIGDAQRWLLVSRQDGRAWYRSATGELASVGESYPGLSLVAAPPKAAPSPASRAAPQPTETAAPTDDGNGKLTFEIASPDYMRQGGGIEMVKYSQRDGDVSLRSAIVKDGALIVKGQVGMGKGSFFGGLGPRFSLRPSSAAMNAKPFSSVTVRVSATTRELRIGAVGIDPETRNSGCYPVYTLEVSEEMKEYTIPFSKFAPEQRCSVESVSDTLSHLASFEVVSIRITKLPLTITVGSITLNP